ncbi:MAG: hypothetical protein IPJ65_18435 [Archangiaceae bacterium]|nr:hypothetical protein [Archangiaceae bacterium]
MNLKQLTRKVKVESTRLKRQIDAAPARLKKQLGAEVKKLEAAPAKLKKQLDVEVKKLETVPAKLKEQLEELPGRAADAVGIVRTAQLKAVKAELAKLNKRIDAISGAKTAA